MRVRKILATLALSWLPAGAQPAGIPASVRVEENLSYHSGQKLDLYLPRQPQADLLPVILNIHGGAFQAGDKSGGMDKVLPLVASGKFAAVSINYRLSGQAIWPAQLQDCEAAVGWIREQGLTRHLDPTRIGVIGHTAGGTLAALLGVGGPDGNVGVSCVVDISGPSDFVQLPQDGSKQDHASAKSPAGKLFGGPLSAHSEEAAQASPINWVAPDATPFLILHGDQDPIVPQIQSRRFYKRLQTAGVEAYFVNVRNGGHGGFTNPEVTRRIEAFFSKQLLHQATVISEEDISEKGTLQNFFRPLTNTDQRYVAATALAGFALRLPLLCLGGDG